MKNGKILSINGVDCSCSILGRVWISEDGAVVAPNEYGKAGGPLPVMILMGLLWCLGSEQSCAPPLRLTMRGMTFILEMAPKR